MIAVSTEDKSGVHYRPYTEQNVILSAWVICRLLGVNASTPDIELLVNGERSNQSCS